MRRLRPLQHSLRSLSLLLLAALPLGVACPAPVDEPDGGTPDGGDPAACLTLFRFDDGRPHQQVNLAGTLNGWSETADRLAPDPASGATAWVLEKELSAGDWAYHFLVDGRPTLDPLHLERTWQTGDLRSLRRTTDCSEPTLEVERFGIEAGPGGGHLRATIRFTPGIQGDALDPATAVARLDGAALPASVLDEAAGLFEIDVQNLPAGKHRLSVEAGDLAGRAAPARLLSAWAEARPFTWEGATLYFPMTDRFRNGDPANDAPAGVEAISDYRGGDWAGIQAALEEGYFDDLGVTALWLSPLQANPAGGFWGTDGHQHTGYHGYWPSAARETQARFGTLAELQALVEAAHARGIRVLADLVFNHVHAEHAYAAQGGWLNGDGSCVCGGPGCDWNTFPKVCWFTDYLPDLDWRVDAVSDAMVADALWWLDAADLDGFRVDAVKHFEKSATSNLRAALAAREAAGSAPVFLVGETFVGEGQHGPVAEYVGGGQLDGQFDFPLYWTAVRVFARGEGSFLDLEAAMAAGEATWPEGAVMSPFLGNHDIPRFLSHAAGDIADLYGNGSKEQGWSAPPQAPDADLPYERARLAFAWLLTGPGLPLIYYGDEIGLPGAGDPDNRRMMPTDPGPRGGQLLGSVQQLGQLRRETPALRLGERRTLWIDGDFWVQVRDAGGSSVAIVALNRGATTRTETVTLDGALAGIPRLTFQARIGGGEVVATNGQLTISVPPMGHEVLTP
ncbi:MAG: alpha-amylase family glycosyl hydrolase [Deltaproteobacteria bacterium]|nr:alpha-amylase family glycosyl hydrolase [Deltaproteobacteria bacterium]